MQQDRSNVFTLGAGYVWKFAGNFYLNPWVAGHLLLSGTGPFSAGQDQLYPSMFTPEVSVKLGWHIDFN